VRVEEVHTADRKIIGLDGRRQGLGDSIPGRW
jgi:hypothetical protein